MKKKKRINPYEDISTLALKHGEKGFPFHCFSDISPNFSSDGFYEGWVSFIRECKKRGLVVGRHGEDK